MKSFLAALILVASGLSVANGKGNDSSEQEQQQAQRQGQAQAQFTNVDAGSAASSSATIEQGAAQGGSIASGAIVLEGDDYQVTTGGVMVTTPKQFRDTGNAFAPAMNPTIPCAIGWSAGLGVPGGAGTIGRNRVDKECERRETARVFANLGEVEFALLIMCAGDVVQDDPGLAGQCPSREREVVFVEVETPGRCDDAEEKLERCERVTK